MVPRRHYGGCQPKAPVFLNGKRLSPRKQKLSDADDVQLPAPPWGSGSLRFGRTAPFEQFYGQLDSVALWDHVLTTGDIATLAKQQQFSAKGLNGLLASWVFSGISGLGGPKGPGAFWELAGPAG